MGQERKGLWLSALNREAGLAAALLVRDGLCIAITTVSSDSLPYRAPSPLLRSRGGFGLVITELP